MMKSCSNCGKIHDYNYVCRPPRKYPVGEERKARNTYKWAMKSKEIRERAQGLCEVCRAKSIYTYTGLEVHHIIKVKENKDLLLDDSNLICLCTLHHKEAERGNISKEYLRQLVEERENGG